MQILNNNTQMLRFMFKGKIFLKTQTKMAYNILPIHSNGKDGVKKEDKMSG